MHRVFVYGSLMRGFGNHALINNQSFVSKASVQEFDLYTLGGFPAAVLSDRGDVHIHGEVFEVDDTALARMDRLEGHPTFYKREEVEVWVDSLNGYLPVFMYVYQGDVSTKEHIPSGCWRSHNETKVYACPLRREAS